MLFARRKEVEQQCAEPGAVQHGRDEAVPRAVATAATAVREHDDRARAVRDRQVTANARVSGGHLDVFVTPGWIAHGGWVRRDRVVRRRRCQQPHDLVVGGLREVGIELTDCEEVLGRGEGDHLVGDISQRGDGGVRSDGRGHDDTTSPLCARHLARSARSRAGRDAIVDDQRGASRQRNTVARTAKPCGAARELLAFACLDLADLGSGNAGHGDNLLVEDADIAFADRAHRELGLERHAELAHDDDVEGSLQLLGDLKRDRDAPARQSEYDEILVGKGSEPLGESVTGIGAIGEHHAVSSASWAVFLQRSSRGRRASRVE